MSFKQPRLWDALQHPRDISSDTVAEMEATVEKYPYFQLLHTLIAKAKYDQQTPDAYAALGKAAAYAPDRRLLRQIFYDEITLTLPTTDETSTPAVDGAAGTTADTEETATVSGDTTTDDKRHTIDVDEASTESSDSDTDTTTETEEKINTEEAESLREELTPTLQVLQDNKEQLPDSPASDTEDSSHDVAETKENSPLLDRLEQENTEEQMPRNPTQSMQQDIIDRFVKANPSITREAAPETDSTDLAAGSTALPNDVVTENFAEIMLKQGKVGKAVEMYQKLMLKYPEKKTYFAQKIDQLKNN